jgi:hypothetical protein
VRKEIDFDRRRSQKYNKKKLSERLKVLNNIQCVFMLGCLTPETITTFMDLTTDCNDRFVLAE